MYPSLNLTETIAGKRISLTDLDIHQASTYSDELESRVGLDLSPRDARDFDSIFLFAKLSYSFVCK